MTPWAVKRVRLILHDHRCLKGRWCTERRRHAYVSQDALAREIAACTSRGDVLNILHERSCPQQIMSTDYPLGCQQARAHAVALAATPRVRRLFTALGLR